MHSLSIYFLPFLSPFSEPYFVIFLFFFTLENWRSVKRNKKGKKKRKTDRGIMKKEKKKQTRRFLVIDGIFICNIKHKNSCIIFFKINSFAQTLNGAR